MGRAPCCDKANVKKGPWSPEEDSKLKSYIEKHGTGGNWIALPQKIGLRRCGKSCRLRWLNYLRPNLKHGGFSEEEDNIICSLYTSIGSRWSIIAAQLPGRTDNDIKNYWNTRLKKKLIGKQRKEQQARRASFLKQDVKNETDYFMSVPDQAVNLIYPYWPELPVPAMSAPNPSQDPPVKDQTSIKNLLVKLGGRFSNDHPQQEQQQHHIITSNFQYPYDPLYENSTNSIINNNCSQLVDGEGLDSYYQDFNNFATENNDDVFYGNAEQLGGLIMDSLYGFDHQMAIHGSSSSTESSSWGDINSLICAPAPAPAPLYSNYEEDGRSRQGMMLQSYAFDAFQ
ncbi:hypothetical protein LguiA_005996 [Lonicera macranthoides]